LFEESDRHDQTTEEENDPGQEFDLVVVDEFGFDHIERSECPQAANLFYKIIDARSGKRSTALATNIDAQEWSDYLGDPPLAMAFLDRVVDGAIPLKIRGKSSMANALRTVRWWQCRRRAIAACDNRSTSCSRRISAQRETFMVTSVDQLGVMARPTCPAARRTGPGRRGDSRRPRAATRALAPGAPDTPPGPWPPNAGTSCECWQA
jgi:hypothetical protein